MKIRSALHLWSNGPRYFFFSSVMSNQSIWVLCELMCWLSLVVRSPPARRSLSWIQSTVDWCTAPRKWGFDLKSNSTNYPDHGHHGDPPPIRKVPMVEPGIEPGTSWLVARSSDHEARQGPDMAQIIDAVLQLFLVNPPENFTEIFGHEASFLPSVQNQSSPQCHSACCMVWYATRCPHSVH